RGVFRRQGATWLIDDGGDAPLRLKHGKGLQYIAELLQWPGRALPAAALAEGDSAAFFATVERLAALRDEADAAARCNDPLRAAGAHVALAAATAPLARQAGLGGRRRPGSTPAERARLNVTRTIADAIRRIAAADARLGHYFASTIRTGALCGFTPDPRIPIEWDSPPEPPSSPTARRRNKR
ncbi:MAG: hypothetical protein ABI629_23780, partial [bacterium]